MLMALYFSLLDGAGLQTPAENEKSKKIFKLQHVDNISSIYFSNDVPMYHFSLTLRAV